MECQDKVSSLMASLWEIQINPAALFYGQKQHRFQHWHIHWAANSNNQLLCLYFWNYYIESILSCPAPSPLPRSMCDWRRFNYFDGWISHETTITQTYFNSLYPRCIEFCIFHQIFPRVRSLLSKILNSRSCIIICIYCKMNVASHPTRLALTWNVL